MGQVQGLGRTVPRFLHNPLYLWTHLELRRVFGIDVPLSPATAREIWEGQSQLPGGRPAASRHFSVSCSRRRMIRGTSSVPIDRSLRSWRAATGRADLAAGRRPPAARRPGTWNAWVDRLGAGLGVDRRLESLRKRSFGLNRFVDLGGRPVTTASSPFPTSVVTRRGRSRLRGPCGGASRKPRGVPLSHGGGAPCGPCRPWRRSVVQLHLGARRDVSPSPSASVGTMPAVTPSGMTARPPDWHGSSVTSRRPRACPGPSSTTPTPGTTPCLATMAGAFSRPGGGCPGAVGAAVVVQRPRGRHSPPPGGARPGGSAGWVRWHGGRLTVTAFHDPSRAVPADSV